MRLGVITHVRGGSPRAVDDAVRLAVAAEDLGYESFWIAQHHLGAQESWCASPLVLLAHIAARTERIRLGTAVVVATTEHPVRLAEDAALLDELSDGRVELGLGAGADARTAARFGADHDARHEHFGAVLDALLALLDGDELRPSGRGLRERIWLGTASDRGHDLAARVGAGILTGRSSSPEGPRDDLAAARVRRYVSECVREGRTPRVAASRSVLCAADRDGAVDAMRPGIDDFLASSPRFPDGFSAEDYVGLGHVYAGPPALVRSQIEGDAVRPWASDLLCNVQPSAPDLATWTASLRGLREAYPVG